MIAHAPVLLREVIEQLSIQSDGCYLDATFGRGGHSQAILSRLSADGCLLAIDRDPAAVQAGESLAKADRRLVIEHGNFRQLRRFLERHGVFGKLSGVLFDLGVSSPQLEDADRGFSFRLDGPLDMRMDPAESTSAGHWLNSASEREISDVLFRYGEEKAARRIATAICRHRDQQTISTTTQLADLVENIVPRRPGAKHPATRTFQAIRIFINQELDALEQGLADSLEALKPGGRLCVISFHSLEDRMVKRFLRDNASVDPALAKLPVVPGSATPRLRLTGKAIRPAPGEVTANPRARSATLRVGERLA